MQKIERNKPLSNFLDRFKSDKRQIKHEVHNFHAYRWVTIDGRKKEMIDFDKCIKEYGFVDIMMIITPRNVGKSYAISEKSLDDYFDVVNPSQSVVMRRNDVNFKYAKGMYQPNINSGALEGTIYSDVICVGGQATERQWVPRRKNDLGRWEQADKPIMTAVSLAGGANNKGMFKPGVNNLYFDECISRQCDNDFYLDNEADTFLQTISSIKRGNPDFKTYMFGNPWNIEIPYFDAWGIDARELKPFTCTLVDMGVVEDPTVSLKIAIIYQGKAKGHEDEDNILFGSDTAFRAGVEGEFETKVYPKIHPYRYDAINDVQRRFYVYYRGDIVCCDYVRNQEREFLNFYPKKWSKDIELFEEKLEDLTNELVFTPYTDGRRKWHKNILRPSNDFQERIYNLLQKDEVYFDTDRCGQIVENYLAYCKTAGLI